MKILNKILDCTKVNYKKQAVSLRSLMENKDFRYGDIKDFITVNCYCVLVNSITVKEKKELYRIVSINLNVLYRVAFLSDKKIEVKTNNTSFTKWLARETKENVNEYEKRYEQGEYVPFQRIRRITGYLVGTLDRFNDAKRAEEKDRKKHL